VTADVTRSEGAAECFDRVLTKPVDLDGLGELVLRERRSGAEPALH
jgi:hypothetical protein